MTILPSKRRRKDGEAEGLGRVVSACVGREFALGEGELAMLESLESTARRISESQQNGDDAHDQVYPHLCPPSV